MLSLLFALVAACGSGKNCIQDGCPSGFICKTTGACEVPSNQDGGGGGTGGSGGGTGGGQGGGSGGGSGGGQGGGDDAGFDAGQVVDPFDDGGTFVPGDICNYAIKVNFDGGTPNVATLSVDLGTAQNQYLASCNNSSSTSRDLLFEVTLTQPKGLVVTVTPTSSGQDPVLALITSPCASLAEATCVDTSNTPEVMTVPRVPAGTYYVLLENYASPALDSTMDVQFELIDPVVGPTNDNCATAETLVFTGGVATANGTTVGAFNDTGAGALTCSADSATNPEVFYKLTLTQPQDVQVTATVPGTSTLSPAVALTNVCGGTGAAAELGCQVGDGATFSLRRVPAGTYYVVVDGDNVDPGAFSLNVTLTAPTPIPTNDTCSAPATLVPNVSQSVDVNAGYGDYTFSCASGASGADVTYQFTTTQAQKVTLTATGTGGADAVLSLRKAPCTDSTNEVTCTDSTTTAPEVLTNLYVPAGTYYVVLGAYNAAAGNFGISLALDAPVLPPANDTCSLPATLVPGVSQSIDMRTAANDYTFSCSSIGGGDAVYTFTTAIAQKVTVTASGATGADAVLALRGGPCATGTEVRCSDDFGDTAAEVLVRNSLPAGTYYVLLGSNGTVHQFDILLTLAAAVPPPTNESCTAPDAVTLTSGTASRTVDLRDATVDITSDLCATSSSGTDVVYSVTVPATKTLTVVATPVGTGLDPVLFARTPTCATTPSIACIDTGAGGTAETLVVPSNAAQRTVFIVLKAYGSTAGIANLTFTTN